MTITPLESVPSTEFDHDEVPALPPGVFAAARLRRYKYRFAVTLEFRKLLGGVPSDPRVHAAWLRAKMDGTSDAMRREQMHKNVVGLLGYAELADDPGAMTPEAIAEIEALMGGESGNLKNAAAEEMVKSSVERFYRTADGRPAVRAGQLKAAFKEAGNIVFGQQKRKWGVTNKGTKAYFAEHIFVDAPAGHDLIPIDGDPVTLEQRITHVTGPQGPRSAFSVHECVEQGTMSFTVYTDHKFKQADWEDLWVTAQEQGVGATRSQGYGRYRVIQWDMELNPHNPHAEEMPDDNADDDD